MFTDFAKVVLQFSAASSSFSYIIFVIALWRLYVIPHCKNLVTKEQVKNDNQETEERQQLKPLHPFDDDPPKYPCKVHSNSNHCPVCSNSTRNQDDDTTTQLTKEEVVWFTIFLVVNIIFNIVLMLIFIYGQYHHNPPNTIEGDKKKTILFKYLEIFSVSAYFYSLFCTLSSCFIFSKIMYGIQRKCINLYNYLGHVNQCLGNENSNNEALKAKDKSSRTISKETQKINLSTEQRCSLYLQQCDNDFVDVAVKTLKMFELWFFIHWILYIVSSFLSVSLLLDAIQLTIQATLPHTQPGVHFHGFEMAFLVLFAISNCIFFLYPCLRAAAVTEARKKLIQRINRSCSVDYPNIPTNLKKEFISFLKGQKFGFRLNILCAHIFFSLNIAYISIFISLLGILIRLSSTI